MNDLLFDTPWYLIIGLALLGAVMLYRGINRRMGGLKWAGLAAVVVAIAAVVLSRLVETGSERVTRQTRELVAAADSRDWKGFARHLDPKVSFLFYAGREQLTSGAAKTMDAVGVKNVTVGNFEVKPEPGGYTVTFTATADVNMMPQRPPTNWKFLWAKDPASDGYLLYRIEKLPDPQFGTEPVTSRLVRP
ncbi:MAG: hypothetical protein JWM57_2612 [Phycisphaerales bacterium]|nr:hypothetical protein [Phycisphaerales bacterium]